MRTKLVIVSFLIGHFAWSQAIEKTNQNKFRQLKDLLPTPNVYRTGAGAPGHQYYQQQANYLIDITLDDENQKITGKETITYINNSPDPLEYLWLQLDQNVRAKDSDTKKIDDDEYLTTKTSFGQLKRMLNDFDGGFKLENVEGVNKEDIVSYTVNKTMMRLNLKEPLKPGDSISFKVDWWYNINNRMEIGGRSGMEYFKKDDNYLYTIAQFYPRMCVYNDVEGWQNKQFLGRGEFALPFGNFKVNITVPSDHIVGATGDLQEPEKVLTDVQLERWNAAKKSYDNPVIIVTEKEARKAEKSKSKTNKTWTFYAENVRDFAFATSRKFIWDAMAVKQENGKDVMAISYYPKEGNPLWEKYSTKVVAHTLKTYSKFTFPYPYPKAISVHSKSIGMEYPMICFNYGRPEKDGTYSDRVKYGMIGVIIHEVGHNYFPMIVNSDERQWTWMDEGLNTFLQYLTEQEFERGYPSRRGPAYKIVDYMSGEGNKAISPIMTNSESIWQFGNNAYGKPATALNILRETVMGRELFDYAFKVYANRWKFKHPTPADFFRTMEDASAVDLDWFWRGWFYSTEHVDISIEGLKWMKIDTKNPEIEKPLLKESSQNNFIGDEVNLRDIKETYNEKDPSLNDFYTSFDPYEVTDEDKKRYQEFLKGLNDEEKQMLKANYNFYELLFENKGGLVMPLIIEFEYTDGTKEVERIPAEIWRKRNDKVRKVFIKEKEIKSITLDPFLETADVDVVNNYWPRKMVPTRLELFKAKQQHEKNQMQKSKKKE